MICYVALSSAKQSMGLRALFMGRFLTRHREHQPAWFSLMIYAHPRKFKYFLYDVQDRATGTGV